MDEKEFAIINVVPFVDIMLVVLTIVLTTSTFIAQGSMPLELPRASRSESAALGTQTIEISRQGRIRLNGAEATLDTLRRQIERVGRETPVLIRADRSIALQIFVDVMDTVKRLGFRQVALQTEAQ